jgi:hypothetical protein
LLPPARGLLATALTALSLACSRLAAAAPEEIQVYVDDLTTPSHFGLDVHNNYASSARDTADYAGEQPPNHVYRLTPEFYYGLSSDLELGMYLLTTHSADGETHFDGEKLRLKFIAPHDAQRGMFWGLNVELGKTSERVSEYPWNLEIKGILGYRQSRWLLAANLNVDRSLARTGVATLELDTKFAYDIGHDTQLGAELYDELGPATHPGPLDEFSHALYAVVDTEVHGLEINAGVGWGLTTAADQLVLKLIVGHRF